MRRALLAALAAMSTFAVQTPAAAQDSSYTPGTVWDVSSIRVEPGQFENYMDYLGGNWRKQMEFGKKEGWIVSYHVLSVNNSREGEPDLLLAVEYRDYATTAQKLEVEKKFQAMMASDSHKMEMASGQRGAMRKQMGSMELQELKFK